MDVGEAGTEDEAVTVEARRLPFPNSLFVEERREEDCDCDCDKELLEGDGIRTGERLRSRSRSRMFSGLRKVKVLVSPNELHVSGFSQISKAHIIK